MMRRSPLRRGGRLRSVSRKRQALQAAWRPVFAAVRRRSRGRCEVCGARAQDFHHTVKPRVAHTTAAEVVHLCRGCHRRVDLPYDQGRLVIRPWPQDGAGAFLWQVVGADGAVLRAGAIPRG